MPNPVLVEVLRGDTVESTHCGAVAVVDADGGVVQSLGDVGRPVFPRSAVKAMQALPLIESGAAERFRLTGAELVLACASHSGEAAHLEVVGSLLAKAGRGAAALECGAHWPLGADAGQALSASGGRPTPLHNNCSGKHAGFICVACALGVEPAGYVAPDHAVQRAVTAALAEVTGAPHTAERRGIDGCSVPTFAVPLSALALGFARFGTGHTFAPQRAAAAARLRAAVAAFPTLLAGSGRFDTKVTKALGAKAFVKGGAEGVWCAALPALGLGIAVKCDDGAGRAAEVAMAALLLRHLALSDEAQAPLHALANPPISNWRGVRVGALRPGAALGRANSAH
jgi:L-asparaginase II